MKIKITEANRDKINDMLAEAAGGAWAHTITDYAEIAKLAERAEQQLADSGLLIKHRRGARVTYSPEGPGRAYAKQAFSFTTTDVVMERATTGWMLKSVKRIEKASYIKEFWSTEITAEQAGIITTHAMARYSIAA